MLDTNTFDYIYENNIIDKIKSSVLEGKLQLFATHIQIDEIQKASDDTKKETIKKAIENVHVKKSLHLLLL
jgi:rRNA-processing protein FCF1